MTKSKKVAQQGGDVLQGSRGLSESEPCWGGVLGASYSLRAYFLFYFILFYFFLCRLRKRTLSVPREKRKGRLIHREMIN